MIDLELARRLRESGLTWSPAAGDAFAVPDRDLDDEVFVLSHMVIEPIRLPDGVTVLGFNGTTEWALDSLKVEEAVWLPREDQLRDRLGPAFVGLQRLPASGDAPGGYAVSLEVDGERGRHVDLTPVGAYARALLALLAGAASAP